jgi:predicted SAM-dependent methyltransferase
MLRMLGVWGMSDHTVPETGRKRLGSERPMNVKHLKANLKSRIKKLPHPGLWRALYDLFRELDALRRHRRGVRKARKYTNAKALKLNVGCGDPNDSVQIIYSEHFFEHLNYPEDAKRFLRESFRVMEPGGTFSVGVPGAGDVLLWYANLRDRRQAGPNPWAPEWCKTPMVHINFMFRQGFEHRFAYDFETMEHALKEAGFVEIRQREFDSDLDNKIWEGSGTLYVNAVKPRSNT